MPKRVLHFNCNETLVSLYKKRNKMRKDYYTISEIAKILNVNKINIWRKVKSGEIPATMVGKTIGKRIEEDQIPVYVERFGSSAEEIFVTAPELKERFKERFNDIPSGAMGLYGYFERLSQGLRQMMVRNPNSGLV